MALEGVDEGGARLEAYTFGDGLKGEVAEVLGVVDATARLLDAVSAHNGTEGLLVLLVDDLRDIGGVRPYNLGQLGQREVVAADDVGIVEGFLNAVDERGPLFVAEVALAVFLLGRGR